MLQESVFEFGVSLGGNRVVRVDIVLVFFGDPILTLSLRIDEQTESGGLSNHNTILNRQIIFR